MKLWLCAAAAATANYAEHSAERLQTQRAKCPWTTAIKNDGGGDEIAYERAPTGLADIFSSMLTAFWYATLARRIPWIAGPLAGKHQYGRHCATDAHNPGPTDLNANETYFKRTTENFKVELSRRIATGDWPRGRWTLSGNRGVTGWLFAKHRDALNASGVESLVTRPCGGLCALLQASPMPSVRRRPSRRCWEWLEAAKKKVPWSASTRARPDARITRNTAPSDAARRRDARDAFVRYRYRRRARRRRLRPRRGTGRRRASFRRCSRPFGMPDFAEKFPKILLADWAPDPFASYQVGGGPWRRTRTRPTSRGAGELQGRARADLRPETGTQALRPPVNRAAAGSRERLRPSPSRRARRGTPHPRRLDAPCRRGRCQASASCRRGRSSKPDFVMVPVVDQAPGRCPSCAVD